MVAIAKDGVEGGQVPRVPRNDPATAREPVTQGCSIQPPDDVWIRGAGRGELQQRQLALGAIAARV